LTSARDGENRAADLPAPLVAPEAYDDEYYRHACGGAVEWSQSQGAEVAGLYPGSLERAKLKTGDVLVDIGCGRGELLAVAVQHGAARAIGLEYAPAVLPLAIKTLEAHGVRDRAAVFQADARAIPVASNTADLVTMLDVVEHLGPRELALTFVEARRILKPGGRIFIHTFPTRTVYGVTYRLQRLSRPSRWKSWPADPRLPYERSMHVNEQTPAMLRRSLRRAGFAQVDVGLGRWIHTEFVPEERYKRLYHWLAKIPGLTRFGVADIWGEAVNR
jgi:ubiquinone/menaquinone biosynthesis C-methylase UbiE